MARYHRPSVDLRATPSSNDTIGRRSPMRKGHVSCIAWLAAALAAGGWLAIRHDRSGNWSEPHPSFAPHPFAAHQALRPVGNDFIPDVVLPAALPPIRDFPIVSSAEADRHVQPDELVLGITLGNDARAYPLNRMTGPRREVLNDQLAKTPIAATW